jgi:hypothetical protein
MLDVILVGLVSIGVFALFVFVAIREGSINKKLKMYEKTFDMINKELHALRKEMKARGGQAAPEMSKDFCTNAEFDEFTNIIIQKIQELQKDGASFKDAVANKLDNLEYGAKEQRQQQIVVAQASVPTGTAPMSGMDEQKIISLFGSGLGIEEIAKQLRLNAGEVEFVLKLSGVKPR